MRLTQSRGFLLGFSFSIVCLMTGCNWGSSGSGGGAPVGGFFVYTVDQLVVGGVGLPPTPHPGVNVQGTWVSDIGTATGDVFAFDTTTEPPTRNRIFLMVASQQNGIPSWSGINHAEKPLIQLFTTSL
jgi:hypothetical protein